MKKTALRASAIALGVLLIVAASAAALRLQVGPLVVTTDGGFSPTTLPKHKFAPIKLHGYGKIATDDGSIPPALDELTIWFDKHGAVETRGLAVCTRGKLLATTTAAARKACPDAIVGEGFGKAIVYFPESKPIPAASPITIFNGPRKNGNPTVLAHAYLSVPAPTTYIVPVEIQKVHDGRYGFKTVAKIPRIAGGSGVPKYGSLRIGREWTFKGKKLSYANASCPDGHLQAKVLVHFADDTSMHGELLKTCTGK
ncbi:MAG TPA: hypothetical protein VLL27_03235 [Solirubrobacterales bacterium]|nr:hypothetical protein [Solirubrobacterales bacterium]